MFVSTVADEAKTGGYEDERDTPARGDGNIMFIVFVESEKCGYLEE